MGDGEERCAAGKTQINTHKKESESIICRLRRGRH